MEQRSSIREDLNNDSNPQNELSEYEKQIQQNIELKNQMFEEIVGNAKNELMKNVIPVLGENFKPSKRGSKRKATEKYILLHLLTIYLPIFSSFNLSYPYRGPTDTFEPPKMSLRSGNKTLVQSSPDDDKKVKPTHQTKVVKKAHKKLKNGK